MTREERIRAAIAGRETDRVPVAAWMHLSEHDQDPISLAEAEVELTEKYDFDYIKMMPFGLYSTVILTKNRLSKSLLSTALRDMIQSARSQHFRERTESRWNLPVNWQSAAWKERRLSKRFSVLFRP
mgnify:CR=1 FL=1